MGYVQQEVNMTLLVVACEQCFVCSLACSRSLVCCLSQSLACSKLKTVSIKMGKKEEEQSQKERRKKKAKKTTRKRRAVYRASLQPIINNQWQCPPKRVSTQSTYYLNSSAEFYVFKTIFTIHSYHHQ